MNSVIVNKDIFIRLAIAVEIVSVHYINMLCYHHWNVCYTDSAWQ